MDDQLKSEIISWIKAVVYALVVAVFVTNVVVVNAEVPTGSMEDTIMPDTRLIAYRMSYAFSKPERFDIVVFRWPDLETELYVKRVIGLPGEKVEIKQGKVFINDSEVPLPDDFLKEPPFEEDKGPFFVPENHYFMLGDNRNNSKDSRYWTNKYVDESKILGKVVFRYYPDFHLYKEENLEKQE